MIAAEAAREGRQREIAAAFDAKAFCYDDVWTNSVIGRFQREAVRRSVDRLFSPGQRILDLGCGTGVDALHFARCGIRVHAVDISPEMLAAARRSIQSEGLTSFVTFQLCALEGLVQNPAPFDGAISNFGALNCIENLKRVAPVLSEQLRPGAVLVLCYMGRFCLWETLWYLLHGNPGKAFRRLSDCGFRISDFGLKGGSEVFQSAIRNPQSEIHNLERPGFTVYYHPVQKVVSAFQEHFRLVHFRGIGILVAPSYVERWARAVPGLFHVLAFLDRILCRVPMLRALGDHRLLVFVRK
jgi:SAM-dependent methyltransferase